MRLKKSDWLMAAVIMFLLLGSFPVRTYWSGLACDIMRVTGFVLLIKSAFQKVVTQSKDKTA